MSCVCCVLCVVCWFSVLCGGVLRGVCLVLCVLCYVLRGDLCIMCCVWPVE